jgi:AraC-like DNA-binding protein
MRLTLTPDPRLRPYVSSLWLGVRAPGADRECVLPSGQMHLAVRLVGGPVRIYDDVAAPAALGTGDALVAGLQVSPYWKDADVATLTVGAQLRPGAALALFGVSAHDLAGRHAGLGAIWSGDADRLRDALHDATAPYARLAVLEAALLSRLRPRGMHPAVAATLALIHASPAAGRLPALSGVSQRHFIARFREATGLSPKRYARLHRFRSLVQSLQEGGDQPLADLALAAGYSDQAHCSREFREFAATTPQAWRREHAGDHRPGSGSGAGQFRTRPSAGR